MVYDERIDRHPPKIQAGPSNPILTEFCRVQNLTDPWRFKFPFNKQFTWFRPSQGLKSRIDFWLISLTIIDLINDCSISVAPLTDHSVISLCVWPPIASNRNKG